MTNNITRSLKNDTFNNGGDSGNYYCGKVHYAARTHATNGIPASFMHIPDAAGLAPPDVGGAALAGYIAGHREHMKAEQQTSRVVALTGFSHGDGSPNHDTNSNTSSRTLFTEQVWKSVVTTLPEKATLTRVASSKNNTHWRLRYADNSTLEIYLRALKVDDSCIPAVKSLIKRVKPDAFLGMGVVYGSRSTDWVNFDDMVGYSWPGINPADTHYPSDHRNYQTFEMGKKAILQGALAVVI